MSSFTTLLWNFLTVAIFLLIWDQLVIDKTLSIKSWTFTTEPFVERATPKVISKLVNVPSSASTRTRRAPVVTSRRTLKTVLETIEVEASMVSKPLAEYELERRLLQSLAVTCHVTPPISNPSVYFKMSYEADQARLAIKQTFIEKLSC